MHNPVKGQASLGSGYKATKIGTVPSSWDVVRLEEVTDPSAPIRYGVVQIGPDTPGGVPIVPIKHIRRIGDVPLHHASPEIEAPYAGSRVKGGDVLVSVKGTIGDVGVVPDGFKGNIAREIARIRPKPDYDAEFLALQLEADHTQRRIESKGWTPSSVRCPQDRVVPAHLRGQHQRIRRPAWKPAVERVLAPAVPGPPLG